MTATKSEAMVQAGEACRKALEKGGLYPVWGIGQEQVAGIEEMIVEAVKALSLRDQAALWLLALAWG